MKSAFRIADWQQRNLRDYLQTFPRDLFPTQRYSKTSTLLACSLQITVSGAIALQKETKLVLEPYYKEQILFMMLILKFPNTGFLYYFQVLIFCNFVTFLWFCAMG